MTERFSRMPLFVVNNMPSGLPLGDDFREIRFRQFNHYATFRCYVNVLFRHSTELPLENHEQFCSVLLPLCDMPCSANNDCWHCKPDGTFDAFEQTKGFAQGCSLSCAFLASLVLHILLADVNTQLKHHATSRKQNHACSGDDNLGSLARTKSLIDNTNLLLPGRDLSWFLTTFAGSGALLGTCLNLSKPEILTSIANASPIFNNKQHVLRRRTLLVATTLGKSSEILQDTRFLGQPLGSQHAHT
jgi:hypothetical protein